VDRRQHTGGQSLRITDIVYVLSINGQPLMPTKQQHSRRLLREGKAKVIKRTPFTIQLTVPSSEKTQEIKLGIDPGYSKIGFSATTDKQELISGEVTLDNMMTKRLSDRAMYRRNRRSRLWYRESRFDNRVSTKKKGWLPPSIQRRYFTHLSLINKLTDILPITNITVEIANFDIQKIENLDIEGTEYQQGNLYQYHNQISYLIAREHGKCQYCGKQYQQGNPWRLHHIWGKSKNRPQDWALVHEACHKKLHQKKEEHLLQKHKSKIYKQSTFMNIIKQMFKQDLKCDITFGNITFANRNKLNLPKTHYNDAFVIAGGTNQTRIRPMQIIQKRKNNRSLQKNRKGFKPSIRKNHYIFRPEDLIWINNISYIVQSVFNYGKWIRVKDKLNHILNFSTKRIQKHIYQNTLKWQFIPCLNAGVFLQNKDKKGETL